MATLDTELHLLLAEKAYFDNNPAAGQLEIGPDEALFIKLKFTGDVDALAAAGFTLGSRTGDIAYGQTTLAGLEALARHPQVIAIEKQRRARLFLNKSVPEVRANEVWSRSGDVFTGYSGRGVIVGIIDTGIDFRHHAFRKPGGQTRILKIWDQTLTPTGLETRPDPITDPAIGAAPLNYGVEYRTQHIDDTLAGGAALVPVRHIDEYGHGTHVAGIAAGDGSQSGNCEDPFHYVGVAPEADLMVVRMFGLTPSDTGSPPSASGYMMDAICYLFNEAKRVGKPLVVNLSLGTFTEKMDGSSADCQAIERLLGNNATGRAIVFAAGNEADDRRHAAATIAPGATVRIDFRVRNQDGTARDFVVVYDHNDVQAQLTSPVPGPNGVIPWVASGAPPAVSATANGTGRVTLTNGPRRIALRLRPLAGGNNVPGTWSLELQNTGALPRSVHAFSLSDAPRKPRFKTHVSVRTTLSEEATGASTITVGSYRTVGRVLSEFSSRGPTLDGPPKVKPELSAPGEMITSAGLPKDRASGCRNCCCTCCRTFYVHNRGTSMAAPHVTGAIALMLHKNPTLNHAAIKDFLTLKAAPKPAGTTPDEDAGWGAGRLDVSAAVETVPQVNPPVQALRSPNPLAALEENLLATERGPQLRDVAEKNAEEVWSLIQTNRRVATIWHRCRGPVWARLALKAVYSPGASVPMEADGIGLMDALRRFAEVLKRYGSPALRADVQALEQDITLIRDGMSLREMIAAIGGVPTKTSLQG